MTRRFALARIFLALLTATAGAGNAMAAPETGTTRAAQIACRDCGNEGDGARTADFNRPKGVVEEI
jgi:hypothetical protein